jgi:hypothetical protein
VYSVEETDMASKFSKHLGTLLSRFDNIINRMHAMRNKYDNLTLIKKIGATFVIIIGFLASLLTIASVYDHTFELNLDRTKIYIGPNEIDNISIELKGIYDGDVDLVTSQLPPEVKIVFDPPSILLPGISSYFSPYKTRAKITVGSKASPGSYNITVSANALNGLLTDKSDLEVTVLPAKTFAMSIDQNNFHISEDQKKEIELNIYGQGGYEGSIDLQIKEPLPKGVEINIDSWELSISKDNPSAKKKIVISIGQDASIQPYKIGLVGTDKKGRQNEINFQVNIDNPKQDFTLSSNVESDGLIIERGKSSTFVVNVEGKNGYDDVVILRDEDLNRKNDGINIALNRSNTIFNISEESPLANSTILVSVDSNSNPGEYDITLIGNEKYKLKLKMIVK